MNAPRRATRSRINSRTARNYKPRRETAEGREGFTARQEVKTGYTRHQNMGGSA